MIKRLLVITTLGIMLSGCFMVPMALIGPAASGFSTASLIQSGVTTTASYLVKKGTGKSISEHAYNAVSGDILKQSYFPKQKVNKIIVPKSHSTQISKI